VKQGALNLQGMEFARNELCKECVSSSVLTDYFVFISSGGGSIWPTVSVHIMRK